MDGELLSIALNSIRLQSAVYIVDRDGEVRFHLRSLNKLNISNGEHIDESVWHFLRTRLEATPIDSLSLSPIGVEGCASITKLPLLEDLYAIEITKQESVDVENSKRILLDFGHEGAGPMVALRDDVIAHIEIAFQSGDTASVLGHLSEARLCINYCLAQLSAYQFLGGGKLRWNAADSVDLSRFFHEVIPFLFLKENPFVFHFNAGEFIFYIDKPKAFCIFRNALENACDAMSRSGLPPRCDISAAVNGPFIEISVLDNGGGLKCGGDIYAQGTSTKANSSGLGLSIAKGFTNLSGGDIFLSDVGEGCCCSIKLPYITST